MAPSLKGKEDRFKRALSTEGKGSGKVEVSEGKGKGTGKGNDDGGSLVECTDRDRPLDSNTLCAVFESYDIALNHIGDPENSCKTFDPLDFKVCPSDNKLERLCRAELKRGNEKAVRMKYCESLFRDICDGSRKIQCIEFCVEYVAKAKSGCCDYECI